MICVKCKKRPAIVFVQKMDGSSGTEGYCLRCAREMGIKPVDNLMKQMGISDEQMRSAWMPCLRTASLTLSR